MKYCVLISLGLLLSFEAFSQKDTTTTKKFDPLFKNEYVRRDSIEKNGTWNEHFPGRWVLVSIDTISSGNAHNPPDRTSHLDSLVFSNNHKLYSYANDKKKELFWILTNSEDSLLMYHTVADNENLLYPEPVILGIEKLKKSKMILNLDVKGDKGTMNLDLTFRRK